MWNDLKFSVRMLRQTPAFSLLAIFVLALGIGVNTAIFSLVNAVLFRPPAVRAPGDLQYIYANDGAYSGYLMYRHYQQLRDAADMFVDIVAVTQDEAKLGRGSGVRLAVGEAVSLNYFEVLGVVPALGRPFAAAIDEAAGAQPAAIISHRMWVNDFNADPSVLGRTVSLTRRMVRSDRQSPVYTIVGVAPEGFGGVASPWSPTEFWVPLVQRVTDARSEGPDGVVRTSNPNEGPVQLCIGRLKPDRTSDEARAFAVSFGQQIKAASDQRWKNFSLKALDSRRVRLPFDPRGQIVPERLAAGLVAVAGVVLVIAVANLVGMLMARGVARRTEMALRLTLGGSRWQVTRRLFTESAVLAGLGGVAGVGLAKVLLVVFMDQTPSGFGQYQVVPTTLDVSLDPIVLAWTAALCVVVTVLVGLGPARQAWRVDLLGALAAGVAAGSPRRTRVRLRHLILIPQVCLSTALLLVAGVLARPLIEAERVDPGYDPEGVAKIDFWFNDRPSRGLSMEQERIEEQKWRERRTVFGQRVVEILGSTPGVSSSALTVGLPTGSPRTWVTAHEGFPNGQHWYPSIAWVTGRYFDALGIRLLAGRSFDERDGPKSAKVAIICETLAMWFWPGQNAIGRQIARHTPDQTYPPEWWEVVGVVKEVQPPVTTGLSNPFVYVPLSQGGPLAQTIVARGDAPPGVLVAAVRQAVTDADPTVEIFSSGMLSDSIAAMLYPRRMAAGILAAAGFIGLILSAAGLYGVISYSVAQRLRELGIRATLGANPISLMALVLREGGRVAVAGVVLGLVVAYFGIHAASKLVTEIPKLDQVTVIAVPILLGIVVLAACFVPARRASKVDPIVVLRTN